MDVFKNQLVACHCYLLDVLRHPKKHPTTLLNRHLYHPHILQVFWVPNSWTFVRLLSRPSQNWCNSGSFCWQGEKHIIEIEWLWNANIICESRSCVPFPFPGEKKFPSDFCLTPCLNLWCSPRVLLWLVVSIQLKHIKCHWGLSSHFCGLNILKNYEIKPPTSFETIVV